MRSGSVLISNFVSGTVSFSVALHKQARRALRRHGKLKVSVRVLLRPVQGAVISISRNLTLRA